MSWEYLPSSVLRSIVKLIASNEYWYDESVSAECYGKSYSQAMYGCIPMEVTIIHKLRLVCRKWKHKINHKVAHVQVDKDRIRKHGVSQYLPSVTSLDISTCKGFFSSPCHGFLPAQISPAELPNVRYLTINTSTSAFDLLQEFPGVRGLTVIHKLSALMGRDRPNDMDAGVAICARLALELEYQLQALSSLTLVNVLGIGNSRFMDTFPTVARRVKSLTIQVDWVEVSAPHECRERFLNPSLFRLNHLSSLHVQGLCLPKYLEGTVPPKLVEMSNLSMLILPGLEIATVPAGITRLRKLSKLDLSHNWLSEIPPRLWDLQCLRDLKLASNKIEEVDPSLACMSNLRIVDLSYNKISRFPDALSSLIGLELLNISYNPLAVLPEGISQLTRLRQLNLAGCELGELNQSLGLCVGLTRLEIGGNHLSVLSSATLSPLTRLAHLDVAGNKLAKLPLKLLESLRGATFLNVANNLFLHLPAELSCLTGLRVLQLGGNPLRCVPTTLDALAAHLTSLDLSGQPSPYVSDDSTSSYASIDADPDFLPPSLFKLSRLQRLSVCHVGLRGVPRAISQASALTCLRLCHNELGSITPGIAGLKNLVELEMDHNKVRMLPDELSLLENLNVLNLACNQLRELKSSLGSCTSLWRLDISRNLLTSLPAEMSQLCMLTYLEASHNRLTSVPPSILAMPQLVVLRLNACELSTVPPSVTLFTSLVQLSLSCNHIKQLPREMAEMTRLGALHVLGNKGLTLPEGLDRLKDLKLDADHALMQVWNRRRKEDENFKSLPFEKSQGLAESKLTTTSTIGAAAMAAAGSVGSKSKSSKARALALDNGATEKPQLPDFEAARQAAPFGSIDDAEPYLVQNGCTNQAFKNHPSFSSEAFPPLHQRGGDNKPQYRPGFPLPHAMPPNQETSWAEASQQNTPTLKQGQTAADQNRITLQPGRVPLQHPAGIAKPPVPASHSFPFTVPARQSVGVMSGQAPSPWGARSLSDVVKQNNNAWQPDSNQKGSGLSAAEINKLWGAVDPTAKPCPKESNNKSAAAVDGPWATKESTSGQGNTAQECPRPVPLPLASTIQSINNAGSTMQKPGHQALIPQVIDEQKALVKEDDPPLVMWTEGKAPQQLSRKARQRKKGMKISPDAF